MMCLFQFLVLCVYVCVMVVCCVRSSVAKYRNCMYIILINALISGRTLSKESGFFSRFEINKIKKGKETEEETQCWQQSAGDFNTSEQDSMYLILFSSKRRRGKK